MNNYPQSFFPSQNPPAVQTRQGQCLQYLMPQGWQVSEDGQFAVALFAPGIVAMSLIVGNSGLSVYYSPAQFVHDKLSSLQVQQLHIGQPRQAPPMAGFATAFDFDCTYIWRGATWRGVAKCSISYSYNMCTMAVTCGASEASQWANYASWLPQIASQAQVTNNAAFGMQQTMQQISDINRDIADKFQQYRDWSTKLWNGVTAHRNASHNYQHQSPAANNGYTPQNAAADGSLSNRTAYEDPNSQYGNYYYDYGHNQYVWTDGQGEFKSSNDPNYDPNIGSNRNWTPARKVIG